MVAGPAVLRNAPFPRRHIPTARGRLLERRPKPGASDRLALATARPGGCVVRVDVSGHTRSDPHRAYWQARCRRLAGRVFLARVLEFLGPALLAGSLVGACLLLLARLRVVPSEPGGHLAWLSLALAAVVALVRAARRGWPSTADARVRLEEAYGLHNQLSAASEGVVPFPPPPGNTGGPAEDARVVVWNWPRVLILPGASLALFTAALLVPVRAPPPAHHAITEKPPPLEHLEEIVRRLEPAQTVDERALAELRSQVEQLAGREPEAWYSHAGLEAAASLLEQTESGLGELASHLSAAAVALDQMANAGAGDGASNEASAGLRAALHGLEHGRMTGAGDITQRIRAAASRELDAATARELAAALRKHADFLQELAQSGSAYEMRFARAAAGTGAGTHGADAGDGTGTGGVDRGPGSAPLTLAQDASTAEPGSDGALDAFDPERAALGDAAGQSIGRHVIDRDGAASEAGGGSLARPEGGGAATWTQQLTPEERRAVHRMFE